MKNPHALDRNFTPDLTLHTRHRATSIWAAWTGWSLPRRVPLSRVLQNADMGARP